MAVAVQRRHHKGKGGCGENVLPATPRKHQKTVFRFVSGRIRRYDPVVHHWNVLEPIQEDLPLFGSIGAANFLHCLPGAMASKEVVFKNLVPFLKQGGVFFGATILGQGVNAGWLFKTANFLYNKTSVFCNLADNLPDLEKILKSNFTAYSIEVVGSVAFFAGWK